MSKNPKSKEDKTYHNKWLTKAPTTLGKSLNFANLIEAELAITLYPYDTSKPVVEYFSTKYETIQNMKSNPYSYTIVDKNGLWMNDLKSNPKSTLEKLKDLTCRDGINKWIE